MLNRSKMKVARWLASMFKQELLGWHTYYPKPGELFYTAPVETTIRVFGEDNRFLSLLPGDSFLATLRGVETMEIKFYSSMNKIIIKRADEP
jgi:hypothetical protein